MPTQEGTGAEADDKWPLTRIRDRHTSNTPRGFFLTLPPYPFRLPMLRDALHKAPQGNLPALTGERGWWVRRETGLVPWTTP